MSDEWPNRLRIEVPPETRRGRAARRGRVWIAVAAGLAMAITLAGLAFFLLAL